jgi:ribose 5-phosphate isomerase A
MEAKKIAAECAVNYIQDGMIIGIGTGSTVYWAIQALGKRVQKGLHIQAIATSAQSDKMARELGIPMATFAEIEAIDCTIDGADEVDNKLNLIKGGGGALLREKMVASASKQLIIIVDESKMVNQLGKFPLPVEVVKFGYELTARRLNKLDCTSKLRMRDNKPYITDNDNYIMDCEFGSIAHPQKLHNQIKLLPGVIDNGLFVQMANQVIVGYPDGSVKNHIR